MVSILSEFVENIMEAFMDDFSVYEVTFNVCLENFVKVFHRYEEVNLVLNWEICHFMVQKGVVINHVVYNLGIEVDRAKVEAIEWLPPPANVKG